MTKVTRSIAPISRPVAALSVALILACGSAPPAIPSAAPSSPTAAAATPTASPSAGSYVRPIDGVEYAVMSEEVERRIVALFPDFPDGYALRDVTVRGSPARLRLVVLHISEKYANQKLLDDRMGLGQRGAPPERATIGGLPAFYHSDVTPNFLVWQQGRFLVLIYGTDRLVMETLAGRLIVANT
jgi:hypothetical protein